MDVPSGQYAPALIGVAKDLVTKLQKGLQWKR